MKGIWCGFVGGPWRNQLRLLSEKMQPQLCVAHYTAEPVNIFLEEPQIASKCYETIYYQLERWSRKNRKGQVFIYWLYGAGSGTISRADALHLIWRIRKKSARPWLDNRLEAIR